MSESHQLKLVMCARMGIPPRDLDSGEGAVAEAPGVRRATKKDLASVKKWLIAERIITGEGFYCNWNAIKQSFADGMMFVLDNPYSKAMRRTGIKPDYDYVGIVGFITDGYSGPKILEVHPKWRRCGCGRRLAEYVIDKAIREGKRKLTIQCAPMESIKFWRVMGFKEIRSDGGTYASRILIPPQQVLDQICALTSTADAGGNDVHILRKQIRQLDTNEVAWIRQHLDLNHKQVLKDASISLGGYE